jgi:hypothetical protein
MQTKIEARTWITTLLGGLGPALYRGVMSHPSVVATGVTPETLGAIWDSVSSAATAIARFPAAIVAKVLSLLRAAPAHLVEPPANRDQRRRRNASRSSFCSTLRDSGEPPGFSGGFTAGNLSGGTLGRTRRLYVSTTSLSVS